MGTHRLRRSRLASAAGTGVLAAVLSLASSAHAAAPCASVSGEYVEHAVVGPECLSAVDLCIAGTYGGDIRGSFTGSATSIIPTADTPTTAVLAFTADSTINATLRGRTGTLLIKNAGAFATTAEGSIVDVQTIVGATGELAGATGRIRAQGVFSVAGGGRSRYTGTVCLT